MRSKTSIQNFSYKLSLVFSFWLLGLVCWPFLFVWTDQTLHNHYRSFGDGVRIHFCGLFDAIGGGTGFLIPTECDGVAKQIHALGGWVAENHHTIQLAPVAGLVLAGLTALWLFSGRAGKASGAVRDVVEDSKALQNMTKPFQPHKYVNLEKGIFVGLGQDRKPVYWRRKLLQKNHCEILGESGVGKSSLAGVLLSQLAAAGESVVIFDPKADRNLPGVLAEAGRTWGGFPVHVLDLRPVANFPQVNPFAGCRTDQVEELLQVALELGKSGESKVDFHRAKDREANWIFTESITGGTNLPEIISLAGEDTGVTSQENLWMELRQLGRVRAFHTNSGLDLQEVLSKPGLLYVIGSLTKLEVMAGQKLLLQRIMQILDERTDDSLSVAMFLDEVKYLLSPATLRAAGTIRDRNCHLFFAHQTLGDFKDAGGLNPDAVRGAIWGNSGIKICYKALDAATAHELEAICGEVAVEAETTGKSNMGETQSKKMDSGKHMPAHVFTHLPKPVDGEASVGVVVGLGPAYYLSSSFLPLGKPPQPVAAPEVELPPPQEREDDLADLLK